MTDFESRDRVSREASERMLEALERVDRATESLRRAALRSGADEVAETFGGGG